MASSNIFAVLSDDTPDQEIQNSATKEAKPAAKSGATASKPPAADNRAPRNDGPRANNRPRDNDAPRGPRYDRAPREGEPTPRPRGGPRAPRGARGGRHGGYDRHSGTGIVDSENKENNRLGDPTASSLQAEKDAALSAVDTTTAPVTPEPVEPEEVVKTLDDYMAEKAAKSVKLGLPEARAANAGVDDSQWKGAKVLEPQVTEDFIKVGKEDSVVKSRKVKKETKVPFTDLEFRFTEPAREPAPRNAFRGGRGGDRGARGAPRGGNIRRGAPTSRGGDAVNVDDQELFPSLGSQ
ncbi:hypothetical protein BGZ65_007213 [Modicella reniformis]|uniref:Hyaluronan/mRNA-binding protein domain-containing protein n=1 Tax=Modicella reniformis TaxID=1440133 RepID=A0A9P6MFL0_9FUNG|nr:hypothetical protein BGZ65_007213 [Modicella reniformis]